MEKILIDLHKQVSRELDESIPAYESLGTPGHQLKLVLENMIEEVRVNKNANPFEITNRVLAELDRYGRV